MEESAVEIGASLWSFAGLLAPDCVVVPLASPDDRNGHEMDIKSSNPEVKQMLR